MARIFKTSRYDTTKIAALRDEINKDGRAFDEFARKHRRDERARFEEYADLLRRRRPAYPTSDHLEGMTQIAAFIRNAQFYGDHLGYPTAADHAADRALPDSVHFSSRASRINIYARTPYRPDSAQRLWEFTQDEVADLRAHLHTVSLSVINEWRHHDGVGFIVALVTA